MKACDLCNSEAEYNSMGSNLCESCAESVGWMDELEDYD